MMAVLARKIVPLSARQRNAIRVAFHRQADSGTRLDAGWVSHVFSQCVVYFLVIT